MGSRKIKAQKRKTERDELVLSVDQQQQRVGLIEPSAPPMPDTIEFGLKSDFKVEKPVKHFHLTNELILNKDKSRNQEQQKQRRRATK